MRTTTQRSPWSLWVIGALGLVWNAFGAFDYVMSKTQGDAYLHQVGMTQAQIAHFHAMPVWMTGVWAVGVWGALAGSGLLLLRSRFAVPAFTASLAAYVASLVYASAISPTPDAGPAMVAFQAVILAVCMFFLWYAAAQRRAGVLG